MCYCADALIRTTICKHIHLVSRFNLKTVDGHNETSLDQTVDLLDDDTFQVEDIKWQDTRKRHVSETANNMLLWICDESEIPSDGYQINQSSLLSDFSADIIDAPPTTLNILRQYLTRDTWMAVAQRGIYNKKNIVIQLY